MFAGWTCFVHEKPRNHWVLGLSLQYGKEGLQIKSPEHISSGLLMMRVHRYLQQMK